jgi:hypothetical protein
VIRVAGVRVEHRAQVETAGQRRQVAAQLAQPLDVAMRVAQALEREALDRGAGAPEGAPGRGLLESLPERSGWPDWQESHREAERSEGRGRSC